MTEILRVVKNGMKKDIKKRNLRLHEVRDEDDLARQILFLLIDYDFLPTSSIITQFNTKTSQILGVLDVLARTSYIQPVRISYNRKTFNPEIDGYSLTEKGRIICKSAPAKNGVLKQV